MTSNISIGPEGESTRRYDDESLQLPGQPPKHEAKPSQPMAYNINTSILGRTFPEWKGFSTNEPEHEPTEDIYNTTSDNIAAYNLSAKENIPPTSSTLASPTDIKTARSAKVRSYFCYFLYMLKEVACSLLRTGNPLQALWIYPVRSEPVFYSSCTFPAGGTHD